VNFGVNFQTGFREKTVFVLICIVLGWKFTPGTREFSKKSRAPLAKFTGIPRPKFTRNSPPKFTQNSLAPLAKFTGARV